MPAASLNDVLRFVRVQHLEPEKQQFSDWIITGKSAAHPFIQSQAGLLEQWLIDLANGNLTASEFSQLISAQETIARNFVFQQAVHAQAQAETLTIKPLQLAVTKIVPALLCSLEGDPTTLP